MICSALKPYREIWCVDFEFGAPPGGRPSPICLVAWELKTHRLIRLWVDDLITLPSPPYSTAADCLFVAYYASAELACHLVLGWALPVYVLDLYAEFRVRTNGRVTPNGWGLLGALTYFGLDGLEAREKEDMRTLALRGGPWTIQEQQALLQYCESDVRAVAKLLAKMGPDLDFPRCLLRGRFMGAAAQIEHTGIPIDTPRFYRLRENWGRLQESLIARIDRGYGVFEGRTFKTAKFATWLAHQGIPWPRLPSGALDLKDDTFRDMARAYPLLNPIRELRTSLSQMRLSDLAIGPDGRNRTLLSAFRARTGRNQPSNSQFIFGPSVWLRGLIRPQEGWGLAYIDWSQQEFGIAAALSGDPAMVAAYVSGDPYLAFARQAQAVPKDATKDTHGAIRYQYKQCVLAVQYGMGAEALALRIGQHEAQARHLLGMHRHTYPVFWKWSDGALNYALLSDRLYTVFGWTIHVGSQPNPRSLQNFPMQANGAEMLRLACCLAVEGGLRVCAPIHDALLIEAPLSELEAHVERTQQAMADASASVLKGFQLRSEAKVIRFPDRYMDERGITMWETIWDIMGELGNPTL